MDWQPIETAPKDGSAVEARFKGWAPYHVRWENGAWVIISYDGHPRPTEWRPRASTLPIRE